MKYARTILPLANNHGIGSCQAADFKVKSAQKTGVSKHGIADSNAISGTCYAAGRSLKSKTNDHCGYKLADQVNEKYFNIGTTVLAGVGTLARVAATAGELVAATERATQAAGSTISVGVTGAVETSGTALTARAFTAPTGEIVSLPADASMSNLAVRQWYLDQEALIPKLIDNTAPLEQQAKQAWELRNTFRSAARNAMSDQTAAAQLNATRPNLTWEETIKKYSAEYSGGELWQQIIAASQRSNKIVNESLGIGK